MKEGMVMLFPAAASLDMTSLDFDNPIWSMVRLNGPLAHTRKECAFILLPGYDGAYVPLDSGEAGTLAPYLCFQ